MYTLRVHHEAYVTCTLYSYLYKQNKFNNPQPTQSPPIPAVRDKSDAFSMYVTVHTEILPVKLYKQIRICSFITLFFQRRNDKLDFLQDKLTLVAQQHWLLATATTNTVEN